MPEDKKNRISRYTLKTHLERFRSVLTLFLQLLSVFSVVGAALAALSAAYLANNLRPIYEDTKYLREHVQAIEEDRALTKPYIDRYLITEQRVIDQNEDLKEIKQDVKDIRNYLLSN